MNTGKICQWLESLRQHWLNKDVKNIIKLFTSDCECYDTPFSSKGRVEADWQEIKSQNIKKISYQLLVENELEFVVEFKIEYKDEICSAINHIKLNNELKCYYLKQWYMCE